MKQKLLLALLALFTLGGSNLFAQTDVTSTYLTNADFSTGTPIDNNVCTYGKDMEANGTTYYGAQAINGWTNASVGATDSGYENSKLAGALFAYGSTPWLAGSGTTAPATDPDGNTGNAAGLCAVWGGSIQYTQDVTLPAGSYTVRFKVFNATAGSGNSSGIISTDLFGFVENDGTTHYAPNNTFAIGQWVNIAVSFELSAETAGKISMGYVGPNGNAAMPHLFVDNVKILKNEMTEDCTSKVNSTGWTGASDGYQGGTINTARQYGDKSVGRHIYQTVSGLDNGMYEVALYAISQKEWNGSLANDAGDVAYVLADGAYELKEWINARSRAGYPGDDNVGIYTISGVKVTNGTLTLGIGLAQANLTEWHHIQIKSLVRTNGVDLSDLKSAYAAALAAAQEAIANDNYANVTGSEKTVLQDEIGKAEPTSAEDYEKAITDLTSATNAFIAAKDNYDALVAEIAKAKALGIADADDYAATSTTTAATALTNTQNLKVTEYNYVEENFKYGVELGEWTSTATNTKAADFNNEHWSGTQHSYKNQDDSNGQGWNANSWSINFSQDVTLPAGNYVFKVAGRQATGDQVNTSLVVKQGENELGSVNDFPRGNASRGINKSGATSFTEDNDAYANNGNGYGWEWRYVKFTLSEEATVNIAINSVATASHQWVSFGDYTVQTDNEANISMIAYNIALNDAKNAQKNNDYANVTGEEKTALDDAISADATLDKSDKDAIETATTALTNATSAFTAAKAAYDAFVAAKDVTYEDNLKYASATKFAAIATAQAETATSAADATAKTAAITSAYRKYVESHALAEGVEGTEQIIVPDANMDVTYDGEAHTFGAWQVFGQTDGTISLKTESDEPLTDSDGNKYKYADIWKSDNNGGIKQSVTLAPGKYMLTAAARAQDANGATFGLFAGTERIEIPRISNTGGVFGNGWNDVSVEFYVSTQSDVEIGVQSGNGKTMWWGATRFRLVKFPTEEVTLDDAATEAPAKAYANVTYERKLAAGYNSLVLPFEVTREEIGGNAVEEIYAYNGCTVTGEGDDAVYHLDFQKGVETLAANTPYLVKMKEEKTGLSFEGKTIAPAVAEVANDNFSFVGTYVAFAKDAENNPIVAGDYISVAAGLKKASGGNKLNAFRAYLKNNTGTTNANVKINVNGEEVDAITAIEINNALNDGIYNLQGQKVNAALKGIYIVNGKKIVVK